MTLEHAPNKEKPKPEANYAFEYARSNDAISAVETLAEKVSKTLKISA